MAQIAVGLMAVIVICWVAIFLLVQAEHKRDKESLNRAIKALEEYNIQHRNY